MAAPQPLPTLLRHSHAQGWLLPPSTHLAPPAAWGPAGCRHPRWAALPQAPIAETQAVGGSCFGWGLGEAGAGCPLQGNHRWEGAGVPHPRCHPSCTPQVGPVSPGGAQDGVGGPRLQGEMLHCCSTHCSTSRSSSVGGCVGSVLPGGGHSMWEVSQPQNQPQLSLLWCLPQKTGGPVPTWGCNGWGHIRGGKLQL